MAKGAQRSRRGGALDARLLAQSRAARAHLIVVGVLGVLSAGLIVAQAALLAYLIDEAAMHGAGLAKLEPALVALGIVLAARAATAAGFELSGRLGAAATLSEMRCRLIERLLIEAPGQWAQHRLRRRTGELAATAVQGIDALQAWFAGYLPQVVLAGVVPVAVTIWVAVQDPVAAAILALIAPLLILFMVLVGRRAAARTEDRRLALNLLSAHFLDVVRGLATLRAHRREHAQAATLASVGERYRAETMATLRVAFLSSLVLELCAMIGIALVAATVGLQLVAGALTLQAGLTVLLLAPEMFTPLREVGRQYHAAADGIAAADRIFEVLRMPAPPRLDSGATQARAAAIPTVDPADEAVRLQEVSYTYPGRTKPALTAVDVELAPGRITAVIGESGAGKSTLALLLMRLIDPSSGRLLCGANDLVELDVKRWRELIAWVPQTPRIFEGTVAENIALGAPVPIGGALGIQPVIAAARDAGAYEFISALPAGFHTPLGEGGRRLSMGQARRIGLARAFMRPSARLLILDEPTAHLDPQTAALVLQAISRLARGRTTLLISHDPAVATLADRLITLHQGKVLKASAPALSRPAADLIALPLGAGA
jgi:ATP-binding cassette, subfamily C, bacterial CydD